MTDLKCPTCGTARPDGAAFCAQCGRAFDAPALPGPAAGAQTQQVATDAPAEGTDLHGANDRPTALNTNSGPGLQLRYRPTMADLLRLNAALARRSLVSLAFAGFITGGGLVAIINGDPLGVLMIVFGVSLVTGIYVVPFVWLMARRRADLVLAEVDVVADATGFTMTTAVSTTRLAWSVYRRVRETGDAFLFDSGLGRTVFILKRGADQQQLHALRALLDATELRPRRAGRLRPNLVAAAVLALGVGVLPGYIYLHTLVQSLGANATISLSAEVNGRTITVRGATDLPDRSSVVIELVQRDEYDRARAAGAEPDSADSPWTIVNYVTVESGSFATSFAVPSWPSGRAGAVAFFWMHAGQPASAVARYGQDGRALTGPDVVDTADGGRTLEVQTTFQLP